MAAHACKSRVPHVTQLWHLVHVLDRAAVLSFLYSHSTQLPEFNIEYAYNEDGPVVPLVVSTASVTAAGDYDPCGYHGIRGTNNQGDNYSGLLQLRMAFPGATKVLDVCFLLQTQVWSCCERQQIPAALGYFSLQGISLLTYDI